MNFHKSHLQPWGLELVNKYPLVFTEADPYNAPWAHRAGIVEADYVNLRYGFECGEGWKKHIEAIAQKGTELVCHLRSIGLKDENAYIHSCIVKEKFGELRWQGQHNLPPLFQDLWHCYTSSEESRSLSTCEVTGKSGSPRRTKNGKPAWNRTLCTEEAIKQGYDLEEWEQKREEKKHL
jgi:hypothetical protein